MSTAAPPVTVLLPVHNGARWLGEAVASVLGQTFGDFALLVLDDASTDGSGELARSVGDARLEVVANPTNLGVAATLNRGLELTRSRYVARMDADDVCLPERLARQVELLEADAGLALVGGHWVPVDLDGRVAGPSPPLPTDPDEVAWRLWFWNCVAHPTVVARREALLRAGGYDPGSVPSEDYDLWLRLVVGGARLANLPDVVLRYRRHPEAASVRSQGTSGDRDSAIAARHLSSLLGRDVPGEALRLLRRPRFGASRAVRVEAAAALGELVRGAGPAASTRRTAAAVLLRLAFAGGAGDVLRAYRGAAAVS